jgi:hypothetical protein
MGGRPRGVKNERGIVRAGALARRGQFKGQPLLPVILKIIRTLRVNQKPVNT